ncbi:MAG: IS110 family transposase [Nitrospira sp.]|nr:IS110 family transposase [Nitrospira sp.]
MSMTTLGIDIAKNVFHVHGRDAAGRPVFQKRFSRVALIKFMANLSRCRVGMEVCGGANYWSRTLQALGHEVRLISPQFVKPYVKSNKNDFNDAEAICEAVLRPTMRFVTPKTVAQQDLQNMHRVRRRLIGARTALVNQIRGLLAEYGVVVPKQESPLRRALPRLIEDLTNDLTPLARTTFTALYEELRAVDARVTTIDRELKEYCAQDERCQRLTAIEGIGPLTATAMIAAVADPRVFKNGRHLAAWLGLVPRQCSSGGKSRLLGISKRGDRYVRTLLIHGARAVVVRAGAKPDARSRWIAEKRRQRGTNRACVAVANMNARIIWALLAHDTCYQKAA